MSFKDVVILLPGILGSVLSRKGKPVWDVTTSSVWSAVRTFGGSITELELDESGQDDVMTTRLMSDTTIIPRFVKIDGYSQTEEYLVQRLGLERGKNYFSFPY